VRKVLGAVEGEQSEGYLVDTQNTSLYLVRCHWRAGRVYRRSEAEVALWVMKVPVEACVSCHRKMPFQNRLCRLVSVFSQAVVHRMLFSLPHRWVQQTVLSHLPQSIIATSSGAVCLPLGFLML